jgi:putative IMPACT (imprinted ancient) family translation regulator
MSSSDDHWVQLYPAFQFSASARCCALRHFGGVKLGAGGLVRAYGGAARDCIRAAPKAFVKAKVCAFQLHVVQ